MFNETLILSVTDAFCDKQAQGLQKYTYFKATDKRPQRKDRVIISALPMKAIYNSLLILLFFCPNEAMFSFS